MTHRIILKEKYIGILEINSESRALTFVVRHPTTKKIVSQQGGNPLWAYLYESPPFRQGPIQGYNSNYPVEDNFVWLTFFNKKKLSDLFYNENIFVSFIMNVTKENILVTIRDYINHCKHQHPQWEKLDIEKTVEKFYAAHVYDFVSLGVYDTYLENLIQRKAWCMMPNFCQTNDEHTLGLWITDPEGNYYMRQICANRTDFDNVLIDFISVIWEQDKIFAAYTPEMLGSAILRWPNKNSFFDASHNYMHIPYSTFVQMIKNYMLSNKLIMGYLCNRQWIFLIDYIATLIANARMTVLELEWNIIIDTHI